MKKLYLSQYIIKTRVLRENESDFIDIKIYSLIVLSFFAHAGKWQKLSQNYTIVNI